MPDFEQIDAVELARRSVLWGINYPETFEGSTDNVLGLPPFTISQMRWEAIDYSRGEKSEQKFECNHGLSEEIHKEAEKLINDWFDECGE